MARCGPGRCWRRPEVRVGTLSSVDERFAWDEGEGDRTREWWLDAHTWYFSRAFAGLGLEFHPDIAVVFERFAVRYHERLSPAPVHRVPPAGRRALMAVVWIADAGVRSA